LLRELARERALLVPHVPTKIRVIVTSRYRTEFGRQRAEEGFQYNEEKKPLEAKKRVKDLRDQFDEPGVSCYVAAYVGKSLVGSLRITPEKNVVMGVAETWTGHKFPGGTGLAILSRGVVRRPDRRRGMYMLLIHAAFEWLEKHGYTDVAAVLIPVHGGAGYFAEVGCEVVAWDLKCADLPTQAPVDVVGIHCCFEAHRAEREQRTAAAWESLRRRFVNLCGWSVEIHDLTPAEAEEDAAREKPARDIPRRRSRVAA
jgi:hypothetical protein